MPLTATGQQVMGSMQKTYGPEKAERVFYASRNKGVPGSDRWEARPRRRSSTSGRSPSRSRTR